MVVYLLGRASVNNLYRPVPVKEQRCTVAVKTADDLASYWQCLRDFSGLSTYGINGLVRDTSTLSVLFKGLDQLYLFYKSCSKLNWNRPIPTLHGPHQAPLCELLVA